MIGTSSSSSTEAWLVHPEPDIWLALSASITSLGLDGASLADAPGEEGAAWADEEEAAASGAGEELEGAASAAAASGASAQTAS